MPRMSDDPASFQECYPAGDASHASSSRSPIQCGHRRHRGDRPVAHEHGIPLIVTTPSRRPTSSIRYASAPTSWSTPRPRASPATAAPRRADSREREIRLDEGQVSPVHAGRVPPARSRREGAELRRGLPEFPFTARARMNYLAYSARPSPLDAYLIRPSMSRVWLSRLTAAPARSSIPRGQQASDLGEVPFRDRALHPQLSQKSTCRAARLVFSFASDADERINKLIDSTSLQLTRQMSATPPQHQLNRAW